MSVPLQGAKNKVHSFMIIMHTHFSSEGHFTIHSNNVQCSFNALRSSYVSIACLAASPRLTTHIQPSGLDSSC